MAYCSVPQVSNRAILLSEVPTNRVEDGIAWAQARIDGRLGGRYTVPFSPVPVQVREIAADFAAYFCLHALTNSGGENKAVEGADELLQRAEKELDMIRSGEIVLTYDGPVTQTSSSMVLEVGHPSGEPSFPASFDLVNVSCNYYPPFAKPEYRPW